VTEFGAILAALGALALTVEKIVSFVRNAADPNGKLPTYLWNVLAMVVGVGFALGWQLNLVPAILAMIPALKESSALTGTTGQLLTGLGIGGAAGFAYGVLQALEATVHRNRGPVPPA
jgi:tetrahydromethanopterin S-methyltransferase subunit F